MTGAERIAKMRAKRKAEGQCIECEDRLRGKDVKYVRCRYCREMQAERLWGLRFERAKRTPEAFRDQLREVQFIVWRAVQSVWAYEDNDNRGRVLPPVRDGLVYDGVVHLDGDRPVFILKAQVG